jgi:AAA lid domain-containing protein
MFTGLPVTTAVTVWRTCMVAELTTIAELMLREQNYSFDNEARQAFVEYLELRTKQPQFANARSVRNAIDRVKLRQASRLVNEGGCIGKEQLVRIAAIDVRESRVFQGGLDGEAEAGTASGAQPVPGKSKEER